MFQLGLVLIVRHDVRLRIVKVDPDCRQLALMKNEAREYVGIAGHVSGLVHAQRIDAVQSLLSSMRQI